MTKSKNKYIISTRNFEPDQLLGDNNTINSLEFSELDTFKLKWESNKDENWSVESWLLEKKDGKDKIKSKISDEDKDAVLDWYNKNESQERDEIKHFNLNFVKNKLIKGLIEDKNLAKDFENNVFFELQKQKLELTPQCLYQIKDAEIFAIKCFDGLVTKIQENRRDDFGKELIKILSNKLNPDNTHELVFILHDDDLNYKQSDYALDRKVERDNVFFIDEHSIKDIVIFQHTISSDFHNLLNKKESTDIEKNLAVAVDVLKFSKKLKNELEKIEDFILNGEVNETSILTEVTDDIKDKYPKLADSICNINKAIEEKNGEDIAYFTHQIYTSIK